MDQELYDEFGNYIGPELDDSDEEESEEEEEEEKEERDEEKDDAPQGPDVRAAPFIEWVWGC